MIIEKVKFSEIELNQIFDQLVKRFDKDSSEKQSINFPLNELVEVWAELELEQEGIDTNFGEPPSNGTKHTNVHKFTIWFMIDFSEVKTQLKKSAWLDTKIYYHYQK